MAEFYRKKKFWASVVGALAAAGILSPTYSETAMRVLQAIFGG